MTEPSSPIRHRLASVLTLVPAGCCAAIGALLGPADLGWAPLWGTLAVFYGWVAWISWKGHGAAKPIAMALALGGLGCSVQGLIVAGLYPLLVFGLAGHLVWALSVLAVRSTLPRRSTLMVALATAAVPCALIFGLAPARDLSTSLVVLGGSALVLASALGIARGRTWGLLVAPFGAAAVAWGVWWAPRSGCLIDPHPLMPQAGVAVEALGILAAVLSGLVFAVAVGPIVRFLRTDAG